MNNSPLDEHPRGHSASTPNIFASPGPARQLFNAPSTRMNSSSRTSSIRRQSQQQPSFPTPPPARRVSLRSTPRPSRGSRVTPGSSRGTPIPPVSALRPAARVDFSNEIIRGDLKSVRYALQTVIEERDLEKIRHEQELRALEASVEEYAKRGDAVESEKRFLFEKQKGLAEKLQAAKDSAAEERSKLERQIRQLKTENNELREQDDDKQEELDSLERKYRRQLDEYQTRSRALEQSNNEMREELQSNNQVMVQIHEKLAGKDGEVQDLETELVQWKAQAGDLETLKVIKKELSEQVHHIKTLESTNRRQLVELKSLRDTNKSLELVEEEKRTLEGRLKMLDELRDEYSAAQLRISVLQDERNAWESYFHSEGLKFDTPESLAKALVEERVERAALLEKTGRLEPKIQEKDKVILELEGEVRLFREELEKLKETASKDNKARQRMERQRAMALKEAEFLREQLKSHSAEESIYNQGGFDEQKSQRIQELEGLLESYKAEIEELRSAASAAAASNVGNEAAVSRKRSLDDAANDERLGELTRRNRQLQDDIMQLQRKETVLNKEIDALHYRIASMENTSTRILQLKDNPTAREQAVKVATLNALREENAALLAQIEGNLEKAKMVPRATLENVRAEVKDMERVVAEKEKRMTRLKEIWSAKSLEFREAVFSLLGWKLDFMQNGRVKVTHMFGNDSQSIEFDGEKGTMKVAGGPDSMFHKEIRNQCSFWMARQSIPCLLASILIEQYEKTTRAQLM